MTATSPEGGVLLNAEHVTRRFGGLVAVNRVDFTIPERAIVSLIGPNGPARRRSSTSSWASSTPPRAGGGRVPRMIARPERLAFESLVWVLPALILGLLAAGLWSTGVLSPAWPCPSGSCMLLIASLLLAIIRPVWYKRLLARIGIFRSARPNDMVEAGVGRTFQNIRLFKNMTAWRTCSWACTRSSTATSSPRCSTPDRARRPPRNGVPRICSRWSACAQGQRGRPEPALRRPAPSWRSRAALASEPRLLLLDEPAAGMNPTETAQMMAPDRPAPRRARAHHPPDRARHEGGHGHQRPGHRPGPRRRDRRGHARRGPRRTPR